ncbi:hypothetical protein ABTJ77_19665, partial [Acinetobacter baumannii]
YAKKAKTENPIEPEIDNKLTPGDVRHCYVSAERINSELGFATTTALADGLEDLVDWYVRKKHIAKSVSATGKQNQ